MRRTMLMGWVMGLVILLPFTAAESATLKWDPSAGQVTGYKIHWSQSPSGPAQSRDVGNVTEYSLNLLPLAENVTYYICISAYNTAGESPPCPPVPYTPGDSTPPLPPKGLQAQ